LEFERTGGIASKKKGHKLMDKKVEEAVSNEVELQIHGVEKPSVWKLYGVQFILLPYFIGKVLTWEICWFWRYRVKKLPYAWEDACYLTQTSLNIPASTWKNIGNLQFHQTNVGFGCGLGYGGKRCTRGSILDIGD